MFARGRTGGRAAMAAGLMLLSVTLSAGNAYGYIDSFFDVWTELDATTGLTPQNGSTWYADGWLHCTSPNNSPPALITLDTYEIGTEYVGIIDYSCTPGDGGLVFRRQSDGSMYMLILGGASDDLYWHIYTPTGGYQYVGDSFKSLQQLGPNRTVCLTINGYDFNASVTDGINTVTTHYFDSASTLPHGLVGLYSNSGALAFDYLHVQQIPEPATIGLLAVGGLVMVRRK